ncbi:MAG: hypothetical protein CW346_17065 [Bacillaceae bacterium]|nr:hypothetical protein [Bacillaceae bacterium]
MVHLFSDYPIPLAGSSGVGYGLLGMYIYLFFRHGNQFSSYDKSFIMMFTLLGFVVTFLIQEISLTGHIGGFVGGILLSPFLFNKTKDLNDRMSG